MHAAGGVHGDLKWSNILVENSTGTRLYLVDLDSVRLLRRYRRNAATKDVQRFVRDLAARDDNGTYVPFFLQHWEDAVTVSLQTRSGS